MTCEIHVLLWVFKAIELSDVMEIVLVNDNGTLHLYLGQNTRQDPTLRGDISSEGHFLSV